VPPRADSQPAPRCLCATVRRAARLLNRRYEDALRPNGLSPSQFELMMTLHHAGASSQTSLAQRLETDQTTLSRNLHLLKRQRWVATGTPAADARQRTYRLTPSGRALLEEAQRCWHLAHAEMERQLGEPVSALWPMLDRILAAAREPIVLSAKPINLPTPAQ
jgi:DNA-binding MarR family transcriptional regulator